MQGLTDAPRQGLSADVVRSLIVGGSTVWGFGAELVDSSGTVIADLSDDLEGGSVSWNGDQDVHRSCQIRLSRELAWGRDQVLLYSTATDPATGVTARFNEGVFVLSTPATRPGEDPVTFDVVGEDRNALLVRPMEDAHTETTGTGYLAAIRALVTGAVPGATVLFDGTAQAKTLPEDMVWAISSSEQPTRLRIINDLLDAVGYEHLWVDQDGRFRARPLMADSQRPVEWTFDADDPVAGIVAQERTFSRDLWTAYNAWRFYASGLTFTPDEGNGLYTPPEYTTGGPSAQDALGVRNVRVEFLDAADQDALVAQGDAIVAQDKRVAAQLSMSTYPFPLAGHRDVVTYSDSGVGGSRKMLARSWSFSLGSPGQAPADTTWTLEDA